MAQKRPQIILCTLVYSGCSVNISQLYFLEVASPIFGNKIQFYMISPDYPLILLLPHHTDTCPSSLTPLKSDSSELLVSCNTQDPFNSLRDFTSLFLSLVFTLLSQKIASNFEFAFLIRHCLGFLLCYSEFFLQLSYLGLYKQLCAYE